MPVCQKYNIVRVNKYGEIPLIHNKDTMVSPFEIVHVDMVGPWKVKFVVARKTLHKHIQTLTMLDRATNCPEIASSVTKDPRTVSQLFDTH